MNDDEFKPFKLEVKTLAEACVLKAKLAIGVVDIQSGVGYELEEAMERKSIMEVLEEADQNLFERIDDEFPKWVEVEVKRICLDESRLDSDGEFRAEFVDAGVTWLKRKDLPQLKRAVAAFEASSS